MEFMSGRKEIKVSKTFEARLDKAGSEGTKYNRFVFGRTGSPINGGFYVDKELKPPDEIIITFKKKEEEVNNVSER